MKDIAVAILLNSLKETHKNFVLTLDGVTDAVAAFKPAGKANPIAGIYAHLVLGEDMFIHGFLKKDKPLCETTWKDKTGISAPHPTEWVTAYPKWLKEVTIDTEKVALYAAAVFADSESYVSGLKDSDLETTVDMSSFGMGERQLGDFIAGIIIGHCNQIMGEISALKGLQNLKGYPF